MYLLYSLFAYHSCGWSLNWVFRKAGQDCKTVWICLNFGPLGGIETIFQSLLLFMSLAIFLILLLSNSVYCWSKEYNLKLSNVSWAKRFRCKQPFIKIKLRSTSQPWLICDCTGMLQCISLSSMVNWNSSVNYEGPLIWSDQNGFWSSYWFR